MTSVDKGLQDVLLDSEIIVADGHHLGVRRDLGDFRALQAQASHQPFLGKEKGIHTRADGGGRKRLTRPLSTTTMLGLVPSLLVFAALGVIIIQVCYWLDLHWFATLRLSHNPLLGHVILFLSRLNFIFAAAVFSAVYLVRFNELEISLWGFVFLSTVLLSIFCYSLGLERLGRALVERKDRS